MKIIKKLLFLVFTIPALVYAQPPVQPNDEQSIINHEINTVIYTDVAFKQPVLKEPNWKKLKKNISKKYPATNSEKLIVISKIRYYSMKKDWSAFADAYLTNLEKYKSVENMKSYHELSWSVNNVLYNNIFKRVDDKKTLSRAAVQAKKIIDNPASIKPGESKESYSANNIDTYANLLYRAGKTKKAIEWQTLAVQYSNGNNKDFKTNLEKMQAGLATW